MTARLAILRARHGLVALAFVVFARAAAAQVASVQTTATVSTPVSVTALAPLAFGNVFPGVARTTAWDATTSGRLRVNGLANSGVQLTFTLPTTLANGGATMPIGTWSVRTNSTAATAGASEVVVTSGTPVVRTLPASGSLFLFIGGRVTPAALQTAGSYTGTITLVAAYTGT
jgi:hypothetical protein